MAFVFERLARSSGLIEAHLLVQVNGCGDFLRPAQSFNLFEQDFGLGVAPTQVS